jgi:hypothetical protein
VHEGQTQTYVLHSACLVLATFQPHWGKPAVRLIGGNMETAASFEARFAPWSTRPKRPCNAL